MHFLGFMRSIYIVRVLSWSRVVFHIYIQSIIVYNSVAIGEVQHCQRLKNVTYMALYVQPLYKLNIYSL